MNHTVLCKALLVAIASLLIAGCEQDQKTITTQPAVVKKYTQATFLQGKVSNDQGLVKAGSVKATTENGVLITQVAIDKGHYRVEIPANTVLPIILTFAAESGAEKWITVVIHNSMTQYDINPLTTAIASAAKTMGGYTHANMIRAAELTVQAPEANKTTTGWRGDPTTQYGGWH